MRTHLVSGQSSFTISIVCGIFASFSISPYGGFCGLTCSPSLMAPVQELVHQSTVVFEGKLQEEGRKLRNQRARSKRNESEVQIIEKQVYFPTESVSNRTSESEQYQVRIKVHQVWKMKAAGLEKNAIVYIVLNRRENCLALLNKETRYMFFLEPTNDTFIFNAKFPPVETRRAVRRDVSKVLCKDCAEPKLKEMKNIKVEEGRKTFLKCELTAGNPMPKVKWFKDGKEFTNGDKKQDIKVRKRKRGKVSELHIKKATEVHAGPYICEASNNLGKARIVGNLTVIHAATSTTPAAKTSSHVTRCSDSHQNYCVNGGECFTLEVIPGSTKFLCRCKTGFTGKRCEENVPVRVINPKQAEELYQKRVLTITGICIALLVVGIMCVVAYCKTKKQRKKLHDRLRQSLRNDRKSMTNGPQIPNTPLENVQLVNQYTSKKAMPAHNVIEKETETSFSTSQYTSSAHQSPMVTHTTSQSWSNGQSGSVLSDSRAILVMSSVESSLHATPSRRGRLNATGGARDLSAYLKNLRHSPGSCRDSPYSERYISTMTSPNCSPPVDIASPVTPGSPPSEVSAPLSSLATSVPSVAVSPSGEEERPLLFAIPPRSKENLTREDHSQYKRISAHYNHGHETHSPPPRIVEHDKYESTQEYVTTTINMAYFPAQSIPKKLEKTNNNNGQRAKRTMANGHVDHKMESNSSSCGSSESETEDERVGEDTPFLSIQIPVAVTLDTALRPTDSSRTNPALQLSPQDDLQARLSCVIVNQDPIAV
ncbi:pro-neuregulin-1, membrane-bound isoform isoform X3 [Hypomesus transpacificus]|uniref:pro-neuregulin-1, membrane-bound isoform isoform X3 n=1 Tax=Hypomesus transpacificus TaxID=137520 RepID=UPI001F086667|nr:pro-neuregulin-1, membrane-bound isoform isoform X3 [Hypomesus transpacificus]